MERNSRTEEARRIRMLEIVDERDRLRKALKRIAEFKTLPDGEKYVSYEQGWFGVAEFAEGVLDALPESVKPDDGK